MSRKFTLSRALCVGAALLVGSAVALPVLAQTAPSPSRSAIEARKAAFVLIAANFRPLNAIIKGEKAYDATEVQKRLARLDVLAEYLNEAFPDVSNTGLPDTKAKAEIWTNHDAFAKKLSDFQTHTKNLVQVNATEKSASEAFKTAFTSVAGDCKSCHDDFKEK